MNELGLTLGGQSFPHLLYHFVLTYSNWEAVTLCYSESFESLSEGLQNALWNLGGAPLEHRTDRLSTDFKPSTVPGPLSSPGLRMTAGAVRTPARLEGTNRSPLEPRLSSWPDTK